MRAFVPYAFNLTLDSEASFAVERLHARLAALGVLEHDLVTQYGACVTLLVVSDRVHAKTVADVLAWKLPIMGALPVVLIEPCVIMGMPPTLSLRASPTDRLLTLHKAIYTELPEEEVHLHYRPAYWRPHLKLASVYGEQATGGMLVARLATEWQPMTGMLDRLEVMQFPPVQSIWQAPLRSAEMNARID